MQIRNPLTLIVGALVIATLHLAPAAAQGRYTTRDAQYVAATNNRDVLNYVVCMEAAVGAKPRRMGIKEAIDASARECQRLAARINNLRNEPNAQDIQLNILECGFRPGDASPDQDCGSTIATTGNGGNSAAPRPPRPGGGAPRPPRPGGGTAGTPPSGQTDGPLEPDMVDRTPRIFKLGKWVDGFEAVGQTLWVAESGQRTVAQVNLNDGKVIQRIKVGRLPTTMIATPQGRVYTLVATDSVVKRVDGGRARTLSNLGECPEDLTFDGRMLWALTLPECGSVSSRVIRIDASNGKLKKSKVLGEWGQVLTTYGNEVWVGHARGPAISVVDKSSMRVRTIDLQGPEVWSITANSTFVYAAGRYDGTENDGVIVKIDPVSRRDLARYSVTELVQQITADDTYVVAAGIEGTIWVLSASTLDIVRTIRLTTGKFDPRDLKIVGDKLLVSHGQYEGDLGAVYVIDDWRPDIPESGGPTTGSGGFPVAAGSWGGKVRRGPGMDFDQVASLQEGDQVTLLENTKVMMNGYPWFRIRNGAGLTGYQWGGLLCSGQTIIDGTYDTCSFRVLASAGNGGQESAGRPSIRQTIRFASGSDNATVNGVLNRGQNAVYTVEARAGQQMFIALESKEGDADLTVRANGRKFGQANEDRYMKEWYEVLNSTGTYEISVDAGTFHDKAVYELWVEIR